MGGGYANCDGVWIDRLRYDGSTADVAGTTVSLLFAVTDAVSLRVIGSEYPCDHVRPSSSAMRGATSLAHGSWRKADAVQSLLSAALVNLALLVLAAVLPVRAAHAGGNWLGVAHQLATSGAAVDLTPHGTQPGLSYPLATSDNCSGCHGGSGPATAPTFRPHPTWAGSMMANATRDPLFWAALDVANNDVPGAGDYCLRCHTSEGWYGGRVVKAGFGALNDVTKGAAGCLLQGTYDAPDDYSDFSGLGCHFCHRMMAKGPANEPLPDNGAAWLDDHDCDGRGEPCRRGPYAYAPAVQQPPHAWKYSALHTDSAICGQCHDVTTPDTSDGPLKTLKLANGTDTGVPFPIERTFSEWNRSLFSDLIFRDGLGDPPPGVPALVRAQTCQACHMPTSVDPDATACTLGGYPNRSGNLPTHAFAGGNTWIPQVIKGEFSDTSAIPGSFEGIGRQASFDQTSEWAREMLLSAADVTTSINSYSAPTGSAAGAIAVVVKVTNLSGHKLPSGYSEGRRMWLNVQVHAANGTLIAQSGAYDAATAVLTKDAQARVYEVLQGIFNHNGNNTCDAVNSSGKSIFHFVANDCVVKDNRIPPLGLKPATTADPNGYEVRPVAAVYPETAPGSGILVNYDNTSYTFAIPAGTVGPLNVTARLYYQTASRDYIEFLRDEAADQGIAGENLMCSGQSNRPFVVGPKDRTRGQYMHDLWTNYGKSPPELMQLSSASTPN